MVPKDNFAKYLFTEMKDNGDSLRLEIESLGLDLKLDEILLELREIVSTLQTPH